MRTLWHWVKQGLLPRRRKRGHVEEELSQPPQQRQRPRLAAFGAAHVGISIQVDRNAQCRRAD